MKDYYISTIKKELGDEFESTFLLKDIKVSKSLTTTWANCLLFDRTGEIPGVIFGEDAVQAEKLKGKIVYVRGMAKPNNGGLQIRIKTLRENDATADISDFVPGITQEQRADLFKRLNVLIGGVKDRVLNQLLRAVFGAYGKVYAGLPGGYRHHVFAGGLLAHTVEVAELTDIICRQKGGWYNGQATVDRELAVTGALLHDLGKCMEFKPFPFGEKRDDAPFLNYKIRGSFLVSQIIMNLAAQLPESENKAKDIERLKAIMPLLSNMALNCHKRNDEPPRTKEGRIVQNADVVSADSDAYDFEEESFTQEKPEGGFFYSRYFGCNMLAAGKEE